MDSSHHLRCPGPLIHVFFTKLPAFGQIARMEGVVGKTRGEEFATVLEGGRAVNEVQGVSANLGHAAQSQHHIVAH